MDQQTGTVITFAIYLALMMAIGVWIYRRTSTLSDFLLGGRSLNSFTAALSANASDMSAWLLLGLPGAAYTGGISAGWIGVGLAVGLYLSWLLMAARLRTYTEITTDLHTGKAANALTLSAFLEHRFEDRRGLLRMVSAIVIIIFYGIYVSSGLVATGVLFDQLFGMPAAPAMGIGLLAIVSYTFLGGFLAVSYTDVLQGLLMWSALLAVPILVLVSLGGLTAAGDLIGGQSQGLLSPVTEVSLADGAWTEAGGLGAIVIISSLAWGFGYFGQPHILARFMGIRSPQAVPAARRIGVTWSATGMALAVGVGVLGIAYFADDPLPADQAESVFIRLISDLVPPWLAGVLLAAILAAIMSTADSQLLVASSALTEDVYRARFRRSAPPMVLVWVGRVTVVAVAVVAYLLALRGGTVLDLVGYAWAGFGAAFGPPLLLALFWKRCTWVGALAAMLGGALTVVVYRQVDTIGLYEMVPGIAVAFLAAFVFNRFGPAPSETAKADFDRSIELSATRR